MSTSISSFMKVSDVHDTSFPRTRYQGSKRKLAPSIVQHLSTLEFDTALDAFGGTGAVGYHLKCQGKAVTYNDLLLFNYQIGLALIENDSIRLSTQKIEHIDSIQSHTTYKNFIEKKFDDIYFTREENHWLDIVVANIGKIVCPYQRAIAWFALYQAAMTKRPYNLFHRKNLYMRLAKVERGFGNKASWDRSFKDHFVTFANEANEAVVDSDGRCKAMCEDIFAVEPHYDLVYIDTPYINPSGVGVDYRDFYHFLEGMTNYEDWPDWIDLHSKHRRLIREKNPWCDPTLCHEQFRRLFEHFNQSTLVVSYRNNGIPSINEIVKMLRCVKRSVKIIDGPAYQYALSTNCQNREVLLIATDW